MSTARVLLLLSAIFLPYAARIPGGPSWMSQYADAGLAGFLFLQAFHAIAWAPLLAGSFLFTRPLWMWVSAVPAFVLLAWAHGTLDLNADAQSAIALVFIPMAALPLSLAGILIAWIGQSKEKRKNEATART